MATFIFLYVFVIASTQDVPLRINLTLEIFKYVEYIILNTIIVTLKLRNGTVM